MPADQLIMATTVNQLSEKIESLYWEAVRREVCNMILFFLEVQGHKDIYKAPDGIPECSRFREMFDVWSKHATSLVDVSVQRLR